MKNTEQVSTRQLNIIPQGNIARVEGVIPDDLEELLQMRFSWVSPMDLTEEVKFYSSGRMYSGVIYSFIDYVVKLGYKCDVTLPKLTKEFDWNFTGTYRFKQKEAVEALYTKRYGFLKAVMRFGKTVVLAGLVCKIGKRAAIITNQEEPLTQTVKTFRQFTDIESVGQVGDYSSSLGDVTVYTIQSIMSAWRRGEDDPIIQHLRNTSVFLVDEAHRAGADSYITLFTEIIGGADFIIGVSGTPYRTDERDDYLKALIGEVIFDADMGELIEVGSLCPFSVYVASVPSVNFGYTDREERESNQYIVRRQYQKVYKNYIVKNNRRHLIIKAFVEECLENGMTCAVIVDQVAHALALHKHIPQATILHAGTKDRKQIVDKLHHREVQCVITTLFQEAVDVPSLDCVVLASGGKSSVKLQQRLRNLTVFEGELRTGYYKKERAHILYLKDNTDFLRSHSAMNVKLLKKLVKTHSSNSYKELILEI